MILTAHWSGNALWAASSNLQFKHLTTTDGLPNSTVLCFTQDKYGFIWMGTENGLCRFDGRAVKSFYHRRDNPRSMSHNRAAALYTDEDGKMWIGTAQGLDLFDHETQTFRRFPLPQGVFVNHICEATPGVLWLATLKGVQFFDRKQMRFIYSVGDQRIKQQLDQLHIAQIKTDKQGLIYLATTDGIRVVDKQFRHLRQYCHNPNDPLTVSEGFVNALAPDGTGHVWLSPSESKGNLERLNIQTGHVERVSFRQYAETDNMITIVSDLLIDRCGDLWIGTNFNGLIKVESTTRHAIHYKHDPFIKSSLRGFSIMGLFQDKEGQVWVGSALMGANWCNPANSLFTTFQETYNPATSLPNHWARAAVEDTEGNLWLGTGKGVAVYQNGKGFIRRYTARDLPLPYYSIRSLARDSSGYIWVGTGAGLSQFSPKTNQMLTLTEPDSAGGGFYWSLLVTRKGELLGGASGGLRRYNPRLNRLEILKNDSLYRPYARWPVRYLAQADDGGLWVGFLRNGLLYWHPDRKQIKHYTHIAGDAGSLVDDYVTSIVTDHSGWVWVATLNGLCALDPKRQRFQVFDHLFKSNLFGALMVDRKNRIWIGTSDGLYCLAADRKTVYRFGQEDGLPTNEINDQRPYQLRDGRFCYPTMQGFALFDPEALLASIRTPAPTCYLTNFSVFNHRVSLGQNLEAVKRISLKAEENFFSLDWAALHYANPDKCTFSYRLIGLDRDWIHTKRPTAQYTNVPGGDYTFEFRASLSPDRCDGPIQRIHVHVDTVFYKTWSFIGFVVLTIALGATMFYQYRMRQAFRLARLQMRASHLEKDNALVQYQNLVNQLNPHFLFNSLAVLDGLITKDARLAVKYLSRITKVYRYLIENDRVETVPLEKELRFTNDFINLLMTRYGQGLQVDVEVPATLNERMIVPVTLQNLIENAIKHNTTDDESPLRIRIYAAQEYLFVENNLQKRAVVKTSNRKGLRDLKTLYGYLTDRPLMLTETDSVFIVQVPLLP